MINLENNGYKKSRNNLFYKEFNSFRINVFIAESFLIRRIVKEDKIIDISRFDTIEQLESDSLYKLISNADFYKDTKNIKIKEKIYSPKNHLIKDKKTITIKEKHILKNSTEDDKNIQHVRKLISSHMKESYTPISKNKKIVKNIEKIEMEISNGNK